MKILKAFVTLCMICVIILISFDLSAQDDTAIVTPTTEAGENLDLMAILEIFKDCESLEEFEKKINDEGSEVNNIDLNEDGEVDYIRVVEYVEGNTHVIVLQATIGEDQYQDVASIVLEKDDQGDISAQAVGDEDIYGEDYIVEPVEEVEVTTTVVVVVVFSPGYSPWISPYMWHRYPVWFHPWSPVSRSIYMSRMHRYNKHKYRHTKHRRSKRGKSIYTTNRRSSPKASPGPSKQQHKKQQPKQQQHKQQQHKQHQKKKTTQQHRKK